MLKAALCILALAAVTSAQKGWDRRRTLVPWSRPPIRWTKPPPRLTKPPPRWTKRPTRWTKRPTRWTKPTTRRTKPTTGRTRPPVIERAEIADFAFLVDTTGSMQRYIDGTRDAILEIVNSLVTTGVEELRVAFVGYRDFGDTPHFEILTFTESVDDFRSFVCDIRARGGGDGPEDVFGGLEKIGELDWRRAAGTRVLFHIADSPCHGTQYHDISWSSYPGGDPEGRSLNSLLQKLKRRKVEYSFGRIRASRTDKMIRKFSEVWGDTIPQFDITTTGGARSCTGITRSRVVRPKSRVSSRAGSNSIASSALEALRAGYEKARSRLGES